MAHYAELGVDNIVKRVLYVSNKDCMTEGGIEKEEIGRAHLEKNHGGTWMKCSNFTCDGVHREGRTPFRANGPSHFFTQYSASFQLIEGSNCSFI